MRSFIVFLCLIPILLFSCQSVPLEAQLKEAIKDKKAEIGIAVIIDGKDTITVNNDNHYPLMSVFKFHQALALADYMAKHKQSLDTLLKIEKSDLKPDTYSPLRDKYPQGEIEMSIADLLRYTLQQSDNNACDILFNYQGGTDAVDKYIHSLGIQDCAIVGTEAAMHEDLDLCYQNWSTPLAAAELLEIFRREPLFAKEYKDFIWQTMVECQTGQDRMVAPLLDKKVTVGHKTGTGDHNAKGQQIGCNDIGFVLLPDGRTYSIAVFVKDSEESFADNSKIIADISRIVYEYVMQSTKRGNNS
ncbi:class A beta-lactamase, subclass A2 [Bacteroides acidifaciens]|uniref:beta-lactamase n=2 Tax=Bacteroides acidifaciens TaxID=85831 RepID=A0A7J0A2H0_9BACE|nr:class A beta-lactamase, subclass A2 [Bacteroides acidifaciens]MBF0729506.1 class A beta-lactamase, subclass A2 [Bacteroides acidifaciens]MBF0835067.1 class A beta-lactamase, subclass A2 [Bacteroides acidifaciens]NDO52864.1 class A beta-lactamase, subclass A2 [Bacteroides acidifaciens]TFU50013.1 class A beta-lactamase, subclass A2 [Bacteroides acidifaciens]GFH86564.1 extended-spectrum beta-lactamase PER-1 [Bacteroides acidifaciens]